MKEKFETAYQKFSKKWNLCMKNVIFKSFFNNIFSGQSPHELNFRYWVWAFWRIEHDYHNLAGWLLIDLLILKSWRVRGEIKPGNKGVNHIICKKKPGSVHWTDNSSAYTHTLKVFITSNFWNRWSICWRQAKLPNELDIMFNFSRSQLGRG
jgi:hypothetical protein